MVVVGVYVAQQDGMSVKRIDHYIDLAIIKQITESCAPPRRDNSQPGSFHRRNRRKFLAAIIMEKLRPLREACPPVLLVHSRIYVSIHGENIFPAVVVVVEECVSPSEEGNGRLGNSPVVAH